MKIEVKIKENKKYPKPGDVCLWRDVPVILCESRGSTVMNTEEGVVFTRIDTGRVDGWRGYTIQEVVDRGWLRVIEKQPTFKIEIEKQPTWE